MATFGSYRYAPSKRWTLFPSVSAGWRLSEEAFIKELLPFVDNIKLRVSYGESGRDAGSAYQYVAVYTANSNRGYVFDDGSLTVGMYPPGVVTDQLSWVTSVISNAGIDFDLWKGKLGGSIHLDGPVRNRSLDGRRSGQFTDTAGQLWIDMRLAEIYLNYAEAVVESGKGDAAAAASYINALRHRAGHKDNIPLTLDNVLKERRIELAFEGLRFWDMVRRRDYHSFFTAGKRHALVPMIDLREPTPKYVFVRVNLYYDEQAGGRTFNPNNYYFSIPGVNTSNLVQNPGH